MTATGFPIVDEITPFNGPIAGGTSVTITGRNFTGTTSVKFDGVSASFTVVDDNTITATTPAGSTAGSILVVLINGAGSSDGPLVAVDSSGNGIDGTYEGGSGWIAGLVPDGDAVYENTDANPLVVAYDAAGFLDGNAACSVELWYQIPVLESSVSPLRSVSMNLTSDDASQHLQFVGPAYDGLHFNYNAALDVLGDAPSVHPGGTFVVDTASTLPVDGAPHHLVMTYTPDATTSTLSSYVDGVLVLTIDRDQADNPVAAPTFTEALTTLEVITFGGGIFSVDVAIDELAFYPTALSGSEVASHFASASVSYAAYAADVLADSPSAYYRFDDNRENGFFDYLGSSGWFVGAIGMAA